MSRKFIFTFFFLLSFKALAHSQSPISDKDISLNGRSMASITVKNTRKEAQSFQMYLDGIEYGKPFNLGPHKKKTISVFIKGIMPDTLETHFICSQSKPLEGDMFATRICTKFNVQYPRKKIEQFFKNKGVVNDN